METATVILNIHKRKQKIDIEIPLYITTNDLVLALNSAYNLNINAENTKDLYLRVENPIVLLKGNKTLKEYGIRDGSIINII